MNGNEDFSDVGNNVEYYRDLRYPLDSVGAVRGEAAGAADYAENETDDDKCLEEPEMDRAKWRSK